MLLADHHTPVENATAGYPRHQLDKNFIQSRIGMPEKMPSGTEHTTGSAGGMLCALKYVVLVFPGKRTEISTETADANH